MTTVTSRLHRRARTSKLHRQQTSSIWNFLLQQTKTGELCDVVIHHHSVTMWAHSCILSAFSPLFCQLFTRNIENSKYWSCEHPLEVHLYDLIAKKSPDKNFGCDECLLQVIRFVYTGRIEPTLKHLRHLLALSEHFGNDDLVVACKKYRRKCCLLKMKKRQSKNRHVALNVVASEMAESRDVSDNIPSANNAIKEESNHSKSCNTCSFSTSDTNLMATHSKAFHTNYYKCLYCNFKHKNVSILVEHVSKCCSLDQNVTCSVCLFKSKNIAELKVHLEIHKNFKPFQCDNCKKAFHRRSLWLKHVRAHVLKKTFNCPSCELKFDKEVDRAKHFKLIHAPKRYICQDCGFATAFNYLLEKHTLKHRKSHYSCEHEDCQFKTSSEIMLNRHKVRHKTTKSDKIVETIECSVCQMKFTLRKNLQRHMKIHCKEKRKCEYCDYESWRSDKLREHLTNKHFKGGDRRSVCTTSDSPQAESENATTNLKAKGNSENPRERFKVESQYSQRSNQLLMNDEGDISIVNTNEENPVSLTLRNIGNLTGSITLDERTGIVTMSNINSGSVFLNETTGELTYVNLEKDSNREYFNTDSTKKVDNFNSSHISKCTLVSETTKLDEFTGEIVKVLPSVEDNTSLEQDTDSLDMDLNDDSLDGFDDFDEVLFDIVDNDDVELNVILPNDQTIGQSSCVMPRLDESTGLLTFDEDHPQRPHVQEMWSTPYSECLNSSASLNDNDAYQLLLDEVTGVLHD